MRGGIHSLFNAVVLCVCIAMIAALILPALVRQRSAAREQLCANNLKLLGLALHNYHSAYKQLPMGCGGTTGGELAESSNWGRLGPLVALLPFAEQQALWERVSNPFTNKSTGQTFPAMGPVPWYDSEKYTPWSEAPSQYMCPASSPKAEPAGEPKIVYTLEGNAGTGLMTSYVVCFGDGTLQVGETPGTDADSLRCAKASNRGIFQAGRVTKFRDILDGLSNTIMMSETRASVKGKPDSSGIAKDVAGISMNPSLCLAAGKQPGTQWWPFGRGSRWCDGALPITGFQTVLPPNSVSCTSELGLLDAIASVSSDHEGGTHILFADGAVIFMTNQVDTGDLTSPGVASEQGYTPPGSKSPYGLWGALGSRASREVVETQNLAAARPIGRQAFFPGQPAAAKLTKWHDKTGSISLSARFVRIIDRKTIELEDGEGILHRVPLNTLRGDDLYRAVEMQLSKAAE